MSLQGSIETFAVADVLRLLAATSKTGRLHVQGPSRAGTVWVETSRIVAAESPSTPYATGPADVVWQLLRFERGSFRFEPDRHPTMADVPVDIEFALAEAEAMLHEWRELEHRIPSGDIWVQLRGRIVGPSVTLAAEEWATVAIISGGRTVHDIGESLRLGELQTAKAVARLLDLGLVEFGERPAPPVEDPRAAVASVVAVPEVSIAADLWNAPAVAGNEDESWLPPDVSDAPAVPAAPPAPPAPSVSAPLVAAAVAPAAPPAPTPAAGLRPAVAAPSYDYPSADDTADDFSYPPAPPAPPVAEPDAGAAAYPAVPPPMPPVYGGATAAPGADAAWATSVGAAIAPDAGASIAPPPPPPPAPGGTLPTTSEAVDPSPADRLAPPPPPPPAPAAAGATDAAAGDEATGEAGAEPDLEQQLYNLSPRAREAVKQSSGLFDGRSRR